MSFLGAPFDLIDFASAADLIAASDRQSQFRYIVTPNVDHVVRLAGNPAMAGAYDGAWLTLCDSRPIVALARLRGHIVPRVTGSDLTNHLFASVIKAGDRLSIIVSQDEVIDRLRQQFPKLHIRGCVPPMGILHNPAEMQRCVEFVLAEPSDYVFLAIGSPQSEKIAFALAQEPRASGICLCIGAALEFLTGMKKRAPNWMIRLGCEWLHRLASDPRRLWRRYLLSIGPLAKLMLREFQHDRGISPP